MAGIPAGAGALLGKRLGKYEILALLALGGTAEIYLARIGGTAGFEKYVVVKCLHDHLVDDPDFVKMFLDEARLAALLDHSNIVQTFELGEHENRYYMVMEFLAGLSLAMIVRRVAERLPGGRLPVALTLNACAQACAGLHYAHERGDGGRSLNIVHRDMSPQNLVVSFEGVVKVVDFGIAKADVRETRTRAGTIKGKFAYMSPEQCVANNVDRRTDVFALGVILHELLTGRRLFKRPSPYDTYQAVIECNVVAPSQLNHELDPAIDAIVLRALAKDKEKRFETAEVFGDALLGYLHHRGKGSGAGELSRFFDTHFMQELEEHSGRMRELISGRDPAADSGVSWDEEMEAREAAVVVRPAEATSEQVRSASHHDGLSATSGEFAVSTDGGSELSEIISDLEPESDDDSPERTRIEENPLDALAPTLQPGVLDVADIGDWVGEMSSGGDASPVAQGGGPASAARYPGAAPFAAAGMPNAALAARAPSAPTAIAAAVQPRPISAASSPELAPTQIAPAVDVMRPGSSGLSPLPGLPPLPGATRSPAGPALGSPGRGPDRSDRNGVAHDPPPAGANASGFRGRDSGPPPGQIGPGPGQPNPAVRGAARPGPWYPGHPGPPGHQGQPGPAGQLFGQGAMGSPVGTGFPGANWDALAAQKAHALSWWKFVLLFVAALGAALGVTFAIAAMW